MLTAATRKPRSAGRGRLGAREQVAGPGWARSTARGLCWGGREWRDSPGLAVSSEEARHGERQGGSWIDRKWERSQRLVVLIHARSKKKHFKQHRDHEQCRYG